MITHHRQSFLNHAVVLFIMTLLCTTIGSTLAACSSCLLTLPISATHQLLLQQQHQSRSRSQLSAHNKNHRHYHSSYVTTDTMWGRHRHMHMHRHQNYQHHIMKSILLIASRGIIFRTLEQHVLPVLSKHLDATATYMKKSDSDSDSDRAADDNTMIPPPDFLKKGPKTLEKDGDDKEKTGTSEKEEDKDAVVSSMVLTIGFYKNFISPLLPPACRFLPTCSQYGVQAIEEFGPQKGVILTAWRILRCSPLGGKGYDPPRWPPVPYTYGSY